MTSDHAEHVGTLSEEAARLIAAMQDWAGDLAGGPDGPPGADEAGSQRRTHETLTTECRVCPLCSLGRAARAMSPEVREHLSSAAISLALAVKGLLETSGQPSGRAAPVEKIDLAED